MRSTISKAFWTLSAAAMMLSVLGQRAIAQDENSVASQLIGTWQVQVTLRICQTGNPVPGLSPFSSLLTFARGGTLAEETTNPTNLQGQRSPGQGIWDTTSRDVFHARSIAFINFASPGPPPLEFGTQVIDQIITYDDPSDTWSAVAAIAFKDANGNVYRTGCATATATRF